MRKRLNLSIDEELFKEIKKITRRLGLRSECKAVVVMMKVTLGLIARNRTLPSDEYGYGMNQDKVYDDVAEMFDSYTNHQPQPDGNPPIFHRKRNVPK